MTLPEGTQEAHRERRRFAAKYAHKGWGWGLSIMGGVGVLVSFGLIGDADLPPGSFLVYLAMLAFGVYLLRGQGIDPKVAERKAAAAQRQAALAQEGVAQATYALDVAKGGAAVVAYRNLESTVQRFHPLEVAPRLQEALASIRFDQSRLNSPLFGVIRAVDGHVVEIFRDWIIYGQESHDIDASTRASVYTDGSVQVSRFAEPKGKKVKIVQQQHDMRTAQLQLASATWSMSVQIHPDQAMEARRITEQLAARVSSMQPRAVTTADIQSLVDTILNTTGQPPAEKLKQLSNLRYERLLSDDEFEVAKAKILGI